MQLTSLAQNTSGVIYIKMILRRHFWSRFRLRFSLLPGHNPSFSTLLRTLAIKRLFRSEAQAQGPIWLLPNRVFKLTQQLVAQSDSMC